MKKFIISLLAVSIATFTGCTGSGDTSGNTADLKNYKTYKASTFSMSVPATWETIEAKDFSNDVPVETQVIFRNNLRSNVFTENANVTKKILSSPMSAFDYAKSEVIENKNSLINYKEVSRDEEFNVLVGGQMQKSILILFEGKEDAQQPTIRLLQVYAVNGTDAYTATAAYKSDSDSLTIETAKNIIKSFKVN